MELIKIVGYHLTSKENWKKIKAQGLKGSKWEPEKYESLDYNSDPSRLYKDGAVWGYADLEEAVENLEDDEVLLRIEGMGIVVNHDAHGLCHVGRADLCKATLVSKKLLRND